MTCTRYFLHPDCSLRAVEEPGRCDTYWQMRSQSIQTRDKAGQQEMQIKIKLHEQGCEFCGSYYAESERYSKSQEIHA